MVFWRSGTVVEPEESAHPPVPMTPVVDFLGTETVKQIKKKQFQRWKLLKNAITIALASDLIYSVILICSILSMLIVFESNIENYWVGGGIAFTLICVIRVTQVVTQWLAADKVSKKDPIIIKKEAKDLQSQSLLIQEMSGTFEILIIIFLLYWVNWNDATIICSFIGFIVVWSFLAIIGKWHIVSNIFPKYLDHLDYYQEVCRKYP